jgi:DNA-binding NtrC family response regulator
MTDEKSPKRAEITEQHKSEGVDWDAPHLKGLDIEFLKGQHERFAEHLVSITEQAQPSTLPEMRAIHDEQERRLIIKTLNSTHWHRKRAAELLAVSYQHLLKRIDRLGIDSIEEK